MKINCFKVQAIANPLYHLRKVHVTGCGNEQLVRSSEYSSARRLKVSGGTSGGRGVQGSGLTRQRWPSPLRGSALRASSRKDRIVTSWLLSRTSVYHNAYEAARKALTFLAR